MSLMMLLNIKNTSQGAWIQFVGDCNEEKYLQSNFKVVLNSKINVH